MYRSLARAGAAMMLLFVAIGVASPQTADDRAVQHARRVLDLLGASKFDEVAKEFNDRTAARIDVSQLRTVWTNVRQQAGEFKSIIDQKTTTPAPGTTAVALTCQFEKMAINFVVAFDRDDRIGGIRITPRPPEPAAAPEGPIAGAVVLVHGSGADDRGETIGNR